MTPGRTLWLAAGLLAAPALAGPVLLTSPDTGPDLPPAGRPLLAELFPDGLPTPFEALLDRLRVLAGPENVQTALIPLGRSLQRYAADPDYFGSPRLVVAVTGDHAAGAGAPRLADRLFLGYQPASEVIEAISYNETAGRFEFQEVVGYPDRSAAPQPAERAVCGTCHQGHGPIFARPLWAESNANPAVASRLAPLGPAFHGAPVSQTVDGLAAFDAATDRAARLPLVNALWDQGCPDAACRAELLMAAIRFALSGRDALHPTAARTLDETMRALWPEGLAIVSPDLPNRDPLMAVDPTDLETLGRLNPQTPRTAQALWRPADGPAVAAREIAAQLTPGDIAWIDGLARRRGGPDETVALTCVTVVAGAGRERRFDCPGAAMRISGFLAPDGSGRIEGLGSFPDPAARLPDGRRVADLSLRGSGASLRLIDDLAPLAAALIAAAGDASALGPGPFRRRDVLALIGSLMESADG